MAPAAPTGLPPAAFTPAAPPPAVAASPAASPMGAAAAGPFPANWAPPQALAAGTAAAPGLVPADRVSTPLAEVLQALGRGGPVANPALPGWQLPGRGFR
ncbi:hypothetical protein [Dankookia sp. P2]|uniref:hypothetical protein n=1 Tax=Dankookia sp. P2 TaxID=3423955 RepID=UPI003D67150C